MDSPQILRFLRLLTRHPGAQGPATTKDDEEDPFAAPSLPVIEIRIMGTMRSAKSVVAGFYDVDHLDDAVKDMARSANRWKACYVTLNEVNRDLISRYANRLQENAEKITDDRQIIKRNWLLVDCDPKRPAEISSSDAEHKAALDLSRKIGRELRDRSFPSPLLADSGNGGHLLYRIDLPNDDPSLALIQACLKALAAKYSTDKVDVDVTTFNAARVSKVYGTIARKGDNTPQRPHRMAQMLYIPREMEDGTDTPVSIEQLAALAAEAPQPEPRPGQATPNKSSTSGGSGGGPFDMEGFIHKHGLVTDAPDSYKGGQRWRMDCLFNSHHKNPDAALYVTDSGAAAYRCSHNTCAANNWFAVRDQLEPGWREEKERREQEWKDRTTPGKRGPVPGKKAEQRATGDVSGDPDDSEDDEESGGRGNAATRLVEMTRAVAELWNTPDEKTYATLPVEGHVETHAISSTSFKRMLRRLWFDDCQKAIGATALADAIAQLDAIASVTGRKREVYTRKAAFDGVIYIDLCDEDWRCVRVSPTGWEIVDDVTKAPECVRFRRTPGMLPLPLPQREGKIEDICEFVNIGRGLVRVDGQAALPIPDSDDAPPDQFPLLLAWLLSAFGPHRPYPVLNLAGEQGSAKSSTARILRALVDPAKPELRPEPKDVENVAISAANAFVVAYDNLSGLPAWLSDTLCRLSTGGGFGTRKLYTNDEESLFDFMTPCLLTGIGESASRPDLLERSLLLTLPTISDDCRRTEEDVRTGFAAAHGKLLGALLDIVAVGLRNLPKTKLDRMPRMADFARWIVACEPACPWAPGAFLDSYERNRAEAVTVGLESTTMAPILQRLLDDIDGRTVIEGVPNDGVGEGPGVFVGTAEELLVCLTDRAEKSQQKRLPANGRAMSVALRRIEPNLRAVGITVDMRKSGSRRVIRIAKAETSKSSLSGTQIGTQTSGVGTQTGTQKTTGAPVVQSGGTQGTQKTQNSNLPVIVQSNGNTGINTGIKNSDTEKLNARNFASLASFASQPETKPTEPANYPAQDNPSAPVTGGTSTADDTDDTGETSFDDIDTSDLDDPFPDEAQTDADEPHLPIPTRPDDWTPEHPFADGPYDE